jgi:hypothetical protein
MRRHKSYYYSAKGCPHTFADPAASLRYDHRESQAILYFGLWERAEAMTTTSHATWRTNRREFLLLMSPVDPTREQTRGKNIKAPRQVRGVPTTLAVSCVYVFAEQSEIWSNTRARIYPQKSTACERIRNIINFSRVLFLQTLKGNTLLL